MSVFDIKEEAFEVIIDGKKYVGHLAYQELSPRPLVLIFPNVAGLKGFDQQKAYLSQKNNKFVPEDESQNSPGPHRYNHHTQTQ